jgi:hypothetical protein
VNHPDLRVSLPRRGVVVGQEQRVGETGAAGEHRVVHPLGHVRLELVERVVRGEEDDVAVPRLELQIFGRA